MDDLLAAQDLRHETGLYTVYSATLPALEMFRAFQVAFPGNPMRYDRENRAEIRGTK